MSRYINPVRAYVGHEGATIAYGDTSTNLECPACSGGNFKEKSFSITRVGNGLLYNCYRATCGTKGFVSTSSVAGGDMIKRKEFTPRPFKEDTCLLTPNQQESWLKRYDITSADIVSSGVKYIPHRNSYYLPIRDYRGYDVGVVDRAFWGRNPKAITYWFNNVPKVHWIRRSKHRSTSILLVEDILSAIKASPYTEVVALLGTALSPEVINHLMAVTDSVTMALDADATAKAIAYKQKYSLYFKNFNILPLSKDIKDMPRDKVEELLLP